MTDLPVAGDHTHVMSNDLTDLTLETLARQQPGMDRLKAELGPRVHRLAHAGWARNWPLAAYLSTSMVKQLRLCMECRPKDDPQMTAYVDEDCAPVLASITTGAGPGFGAAYDRLVARANDYHVELGKPFLMWQTPTEPPADLDLRAGMD